MRLLLLACLGVVTSGCDPRPTLTEARFTRVSAYAGQVQLEVEPGPTCPLFPDVVVTQNGTPLSRLSPGGRNPSAPLSIHSCETPSWLMLDVPEAEAVTTFVFTDGASSITAEFASLQGPRTLSVIAPTDATAAAGDTVSLRWSPATDTFEAQTQVKVDFVYSTASGEQPVGVAFSSSDDARPITLARDGVVTFTLFDSFEALFLPEGTTGGVLRVVPSRAWVGATRCEGVPRCEVQIPRYPEVPFSLVK